MTVQSKAGCVLCAAMAFMCAAAWGGENLIVNGDFESSTGIDASKGQQSVAAGASLAPWKVLRVTNTGLARAAKAPSWMLDSVTRTQCGTFAVYMQTAGDAADQSIYQDVTVPEPGLYRFSAKFVARANGYNGNTFSFSLGGTRLYAGSTTKTTYWQKFVRNVYIPSPGVYRVEAKCHNADKDQMTIFNDFVLEKLEVTDGAPETPALVHRYSFNGSWDDAVEGGPAAVPVGDAVLDENNETCTMSNTTEGNKNDYVHFGANFLPVNGQATLEFWFTENTAQNWSRLFHTGPSDTDLLLFALRQGGTTTVPVLRMTSLNGDTSNKPGTMKALTSGTPYYVAVVLKPIQTERGGTTATAYLYNATTHELIGTASTDARDYSLKDFTQNDFFLGNSYVWNDPDAKMSVDEFRVWNVAFTESMIAASVAAGPDAATLPNPADAIASVSEEPWTGSATVTVEDSVRGLSGTSAGSYTVSAASQTFTAPASVTDAAGRTWQPTGYKLERHDAASERWFVVKTAAETSVECVNSKEWAQTRLTWHWKMTDGVLAYDADCYVPNGLLLHLDAIRNAGLTAEHSMDATTWANLGSAGGEATHVVKVSGNVSAWGDNAYVFTGGSYFKTPSITLGHQTTVQIGYDMIPTVQNKSWPTYFGVLDDSFQLFTENKGSELYLKQTNVNADPRPAIHVWDGTFATAYVDGSGAALGDGHVAPPITFHGSSNSIGSKSYYFGGSEDGRTRELTGSGYTLRVYDRILTTEEILRNRELDNQRFRGRWGESTEKDLVTVRASRAGVACETGNWLVRGSGSKTVTAPESVTENGFTWTLKGYLLETMDTTARTVAYTQVDGVDTYTFTPTANGANRRLTWRYEMTKGYRTAADFDIGDYVQPGLILNLDGVHNEGTTRPHNASAPEWVNSASLGGSAWFNCSKFHSWAANGCVFAPEGNDWRGACAWTKDLITLGKEFTAQGAVEFATGGQVVTWPTLCGLPGDNGLFGKGDIQWKLNGSPNFFANRPSMNWSGKYYTGIFTPTKFMLTEGTAIPTSGNACASGTASALGARMWSIGGSGSNPTGTNQRYMKGTTYAFRLYNRALTDEELAQNRKVDEARFHNTLTDKDVIVAVEGDYAPTEAPGEYDVGGTWTFTASPARDAETNKLMRPLGTVEKLSDGSVITTSVKGTRGYTWTDGDAPVKLTWRWVVSGFTVFVR
ncbi:MAG: hypothetical protein IKL96_05195 [Kiritimatiellae bacterium]|nr:hypothetical protein [Kiritimatiellia bacterium]